MPSAELVREAERQMVICNACRYCEGFCAVFPAMELRRTFRQSDLLYLANVCFDCRDCYYACQYAPPHEFAINVPKVFAELRTETYRDFSWPRILAGLFRRNGLAVGLITAISVALVFLLTLTGQGQAVLFGTHVDEGAFYRVIPYVALVVPPSIVLLYGLAVLLAGTYRFWQETHSNPRDIFSLSAFLKATADAFGLRYLRGEGVGCNYPGERFSVSRWWMHHLVFYGFMLDLAATTIAAIYEHFLHWQAPYPLLSWPVVLGTLGGIMLVIGTVGLLYLKWQSDRDPAEASMLRMDVAFLVVLLLTSLSGLVLLALRDTPAMGALLAIHFGVVMALFLTMPYGKFAHIFYRYAALVRNSLEQSQAAKRAAHH